MVKGEQRPTLSLRMNPDIAEKFQRIEGALNAIRPNAPEWLRIPETRTDIATLVLTRGLTSMLQELKTVAQVLNGDTNLTVEDPMIQGVLLALRDVESGKRSDVASSILRMIEEGLPF